MKRFIRKTSPLIPLILLLGAGNPAAAHPGTPGHTHFPDEVDEFDQVAVAPVSEADRHGYSIGEILVLSGVAGCLGFAFFQKEGGIWKDVASRH